MLGPQGHVEAARLTDAGGQGKLRDQVPVAIPPGKIVLGVNAVSAVGVAVEKHEVCARHLGEGIIELGAEVAGIDVEAPDQAVGPKFRAAEGIAEAAQPAGDRRTVVAGVRRAVIDRDGSLHGLGPRTLRDDVDHTAHRGTPDGGCRAPDNLDLLDVLHGYRPQDGGIPGHEVERDPVQQNHHVADVRPLDFWATTGNELHRLVCHYAGNTTEDFLHRMRVHQLDVHLKGTPPQYEAYATGLL